MHRFLDPDAYGGDSEVVAEISEGGCVFLSPRYPASTLSSQNNKEFLRPER